MSDYKVGYGKPPIENRIKPGERRNPKGRPSKKGKPTGSSSDADILAQIDNELVEFQGRQITKREAELRVLQVKALKGDVRSSQQLDAIRKKAAAAKPETGGGVLLVPVTSLDDWERSTAAQQAQFRGDPPNVD